MATNTSINWGGILKGAAIITAVAVAGAVAYSAFVAGTPMVTGYIAQSENLKIFLSNAVDLATAAGGYIAEGWSWLSAQAAAAPAAIVSALGIENTGSLSNFLGNGAQTADIAGKVGAAAVATTGAVIAMPELRHTPLVVPDTSTPALAAHSLHPAGFHEAAFTAKHVAAEHGSKGTGSWGSVFASKAPTASYSEAALASKVDRDTARMARQDSFANQLDSDRANLEAVLRK